MNIIDKPLVTLIGRQEFIAPTHIKWESDDIVPGQVVAEFAGRLCYLSFGEDAGMEGGHKTIKGRTTNKDYLANILRTKHGSVLEHAIWTVLIEGVSRALTHELVRHRAGFGFSQLSQRYVDESNIAFVRPPEIEAGTPQFQAWLNANEYALEGYRVILHKLESELESDETLSATMRKKRARQAARSVLPNCAETKIVVTGNARSWRHFIEMRGSPAADVEIRRLAVDLCTLFQKEAPNIFGDYSVEDLGDGTFGVSTDNPKV
jgi:thymidylate synthase (FAD)